jgi:sulfide:quinone oxidoreductase
MAAKQIVILGAGIGGVVAAHALRKRLGGEHRVILIDRNRQYLFSPSLLWLMLGWREPRAIQRDLEPLRNRGIQYVNAAITGLDLGQRKVETTAGGFPYDYLIVALGADYAMERVQGLEEAAHLFYTLEGAERLRDTLRGFAGGKVVVLIPSLPFKCPAAPYEAAFLIESYLRERGVRDRTNLRIVTPEPHPMPVAGPVLGGAIKAVLAQRGIAYSSEQKLKGVDPSRKALTLESGEEVPFDLLVAIPPHRAPQVVIEAGLAEPGGWVPVDKETLRTSREGVYALGDVAGIKLVSGAMLPKAGVFAHHEAETVAANLAAEIKGEQPRARFDGRGYCFLELGDGKAGFASGKFFAEPKPVVNLRRPGRLWHVGKIWFEKYWLRRWF